MVVICLPVTRLGEKGALLFAVFKARHFCTISSSVNIKFDGLDTSITFLTFQRRWHHHLRLSSALRHRVPS